MRSLWGVGPAGPAHFGYDILVPPQAAVIAEGADHTILLADTHVMLTHGLQFNDVRRRCGYYEAVFRECYGLNANYVHGSEFQFDPDYFSAALRVASNTPMAKVRQALGLAAREGSTTQVVTVGSLLYVIMQVLDAAYLGVDTILADSGQKKIYDLAQPGSPLFDELGSLRQYRHPGWVFPEDIRYFGLAVDIAGKPMNQSSRKTRLSIHESSDSLRGKIRTMYAPPAGQPTTDRTNALLWYLRYSAFPWIGLPCTIDTRDGPVRLENFADLQKEYESGNLHPNDLKEFLAEILTERIRGMRDALAAGLINWIDISAVRGLR